MKKTITAALILLFLAGVALAGSITLTLDSAEPIKEQAEQLRSYIKQFPAEDRQEWYMHLSIIIDGIDRIMPVREAVNMPVYVAITSGKRFHLTAACSSLKQAAEIVQMDKAEAEQRGFKICNVCGN